MLVLLALLLSAGGASTTTPPDAGAGALGGPPSKVKALMQLHGQDTASRCVGLCGCGCRRARLKSDCMQCLPVQPTSSPLHLQEQQLASPVPPPCASMCVQPFASCGRPMYRCAHESCGPMSLYPCVCMCVCLPLQHPLSACRRGAPPAAGRVHSRHAGRRAGQGAAAAAAAAAAGGA